MRRRALLLPATRALLDKVGEAVVAPTLVRVTELAESHDARPWRRPLAPSMSPVPTWCDACERQRADVRTVCACAACRATLGLR